MYNEDGDTVVYTFENFDNPCEKIKVRKKQAKIEEALLFVTLTTIMYTVGYLLAEQRNSVR